MASREEIDPDALLGLSIFPLPNAVLLPGGLMPLHVFEPRYREMTRDCLDGSRLMAVARLRPGYEAAYAGRPAVYPACGLGRIIASEELADGRFLLVLRGLARVHIERELPARASYRQVHARVLDDDQTDRPDAARAGHARLLELCDRLSLVLDRGGDELRALCRECSSPGGCADAIAAALIMDLGERQRLLETLDPVERLERTAAHVGRLLCQLAPCAGRAVN
ncbi:MAG: LON peptidase substrate-binding domain-containing protein [Kofleriaceae bacterium]|nr:LON peptidase substrate-binding domain-containing protein [Kofleriaceae bacterium]MCL4227067.1 LON peptidase substrate-binding domain-containing protein [Myxococcales bacterium]